MYNNTLYDWSTINLDELFKLPVYQKSSSDYISDSYGLGCALNAPGYPSYFLQSVYSRSGNVSISGVECVIAHPELGQARILSSSEDWNEYKDWESIKTARNERLARLYNPVSMLTERFSIWEKSVYQHWHNCYVDFSIENPRNASNLVIGHYDPYDHLFNAENHGAYLWIKDFYPTYTPNIDLITKRYTHLQEDWYTRQAYRPNAVYCPGHLGTTHKLAVSEQNSFCRWCGEHYKESK